MPPTMLIDALHGVRRRVKFGDEIGGKRRRGEQERGAQRRSLKQAMDAQSQSPRKADAAASAQTPDLYPAESFPAPRGGVNFALPQAWQCPR